MTDKGAEPEPTNSKALLAFRLGWATAELLGRLRKGVKPPERPPRGDQYAPRLSVSQGRPSSSAEEFWLAAQRLADIGGALDLWREKAPVAVESVRRLPDTIEYWFNGGRVEGLIPADLRDLLNAWSLDTWSRLQARDDALARAFAAGMSLADTYWYLRPPRHFALADTALAQEDWRRLLSVYRMDVERGRLQGLGQELPTGVGDVLRRHLPGWSIGTELYYDGEELKRLAWPYRRSHPLGLLHRWRKVKRSPEVKPDDERAIVAALARQAEVWQSLIFGLRTPDSYLYARDRQWVVWGTRFLSLVLVLLPIGVLLALALYLLAVFLGGVLVPNLLNVAQETLAQTKAGEWNDLVTLISSLLVAGGTLIVGFRRLLGLLHRANQRIRQQLTVFLVARRTLIPWDRALKKRSRR